MRRTKVALFAATMWLSIFTQCPAASPLPGRIYVFGYLTPPEGGTHYGVFSCDPNTGEWRIEPISGGGLLRISPSGQTAAYVSSDPGDRIFAYQSEGSSFKLSKVRHADAIFACPLDGSSKEVPIRSGSAYSLAWAPDGKRVIVTSGGYKVVNKQTVRRTETWLVKADGSGQTRLPIPDTHVVLDWSPNGKFLVTFIPSRTKPHDEWGSKESVYTMRPDGTCIQRMTSPDEQCRVGRISPNSKSIAFFTIVLLVGETLTLSNYKHRVNVMKLDGRERRDIAHEDLAGFPADVCWSPDGKALAAEINKWEEEAHHIVIPSESWIEIYDLNGKRLRTIKPPKDGNISHGLADWR